MTARGLVAPARTWVVIVPPGVFKVDQGEDQWQRRRILLSADRNVGPIEQDANLILKTLKLNDGRHDDFKHEPGDRRLL